MLNDLKKGKDCVGQDVYDVDGNHGVITKFWVENGSQSKVLILYDDGMESIREKYSVKKGSFRKPYKDDIKDCLNSGEWAYIPGFNNQYIISKNGDIKSAFGVNKGKLLTPSYNKQGYGMIVLQTGTGKSTRQLKRVHQLVAMTFIGEIKEGYEVNHIDGDRSNNKLSNLEIVSREDNNKKYFDFEQVGFSKEELQSLHAICQEKGISLKEFITGKLKEEI